MATPVYQPLDTQTNTSTNSILVINIPTNIVSGDLMIAHVGQAILGGNWSSSGWTALDSGLRNSSNFPTVGIFWKVATGSEPSTYTFTESSSSSSRSAGTISRITGADTVTPVDSYSSSVNNSFTSTIACGTATPTKSDDLIILFANATNSNGTGYNCTNVSSFTVAYNTGIPSVGGVLNAAYGNSTASGSATGAGTGFGNSTSTGAILAISGSSSLTSAGFLLRMI